MSRKLPLITALALAATLVVGSAAASSRQTAAEQAADEARLAAASQHAGESVPHVRFMRPIHSYEVVGPLALLVWETPNRAWLVDLRKSDACQYLDNSFSVAIDTMSDSLNARNGYVVGSGGLNCRIDRIREVDVPAMRATLRESGNR